MSILFIIVAVAIILISRKLSSSWGETPVFEDDDKVEELPELMQNVDWSFAERRILNDNKEERSDLVAQKEIALQSKDRVSSVMEEESVEDEQFRGFVFNVRDAIISSEILHPKWKDM